MAKLLLSEQQPASILPLLHVVLLVDEVLHGSVYAHYYSEQQREACATVAEQDGHQSVLPVTPLCCLMR